MSAARLTDHSRLCIHTITTRPWPLEQAVDRYAEAGVGGITVWRQALAGHAPSAAGERIRAAGLRVVSLCRGGFFPARDAAGRQAAIDENLRVVDEAAALGAPMVVLVCGAVPGLALSEARRQIAEGIAAVLPHAAACRVKLAIEPLHPMYADDRSAINTMRQAADVCAELRSPWLGIAVDVYHVWWDPDLESEIARAGRQRWLAAFHVCDWRTPTTDLLEDRGLPGEGCVPVRSIRGWMEAAGFDGFNEMEVFSKTRWAGDQQQFLKDILDSYLKHV
jgi:sugar phosphate isomerase/epimerase